MASLEQGNQLSHKNMEVSNHENDSKEEDFHSRGDGLVSVASLMMGVGAVKREVMAMILAGFSGLLAGACSTAIGEFVSVYTQRDIEVAQIKRDKRKNSVRIDEIDWLYWTLI